jgi:hypothetical protein
MFAIAMSDYMVHNKGVSKYATNTQGDIMSSKQASYIASLYGDRFEYALNAAAAAGVINRSESISGWAKRPASASMASAVIGWLQSR